MTRWGSVLTLGIVLGHSAPALGLPSLSIESTRANASGQATIDVTLDPQDALVAGVQADFSIDPAKAKLLSTSAGRPGCRVNPQINKSASAFAFRLSGCTAGCTLLRALILSVANVDPIPRGVVFSCDVEAPIEGTGGAVAIGLSDAILSDPEGNRVDVETRNGWLVYGDADVPGTLPTVLSWLPTVTPTERPRPFTPTRTHQPSTSTPTISSTPTSSSTPQPTFTRPTLTPRNTATPTVTPTLTHTPLCASNCSPTPTPPPQPTGSNCQTGADCQSGFCTDGACCAVARCPDTQSCNIPSLPGTCRDKMAEGDGCMNAAAAFCRPLTPTATPTPGPNGLYCMLDTECVSGRCTDGVCCEDSQCPPGQRCSAPGLEGICGEKQTNGNTASFTATPATSERALQSGSGAGCALVATDQHGSSPAWSVATLLIALCLGRRRSVARQFIAGRQSVLRDAAKEMAAPQDERVGRI